MTDRMANWILAGVCAALIIIAGVSVANAQQRGQQMQMVSVPCGPHSAFKEMATVERGETAIVELGANKGWSVYLLVNQDTGSWTVLATNGNMACVPASGQNGVRFNPKALAPGAEPS